MRNAAIENQAGHIPTDRGDRSVAKAGFPESVLKILAINLNQLVYQ